MDRQRRMPSARALSRFLGEAQAAVRLRGAVSVLLTTDGEIRRLNRRFRGKNKATDVLSFPAAPNSQVSTSQVSKSRRGTPAGQRVSGDLAISVDTARRQGTAYGHSLSIEIKTLMLHGLLHLAGYDHESDDGRMAKRERVLRERLGLPLGLIERSAGDEDGLASPGKGSRLPTAPEKRRKNGAPLIRVERGSRLPALATEKSRKDGARSFRVKDKTEDHGVAGRRKAVRA